MTHPLSIHFQISMKTPKIWLGIVLVCFVSSGLAQEESNSTEVPTETHLNGKNETLAIEEELEESSAAAENLNQTARELRKVETGKSLIFQNPADPKSYWNIFSIYPQTRKFISSLLFSLRAQFTKLVMGQWLKSFIK